MPVSPPSMSLLASKLAPPDRPAVPAPRPELETRIDEGARVRASIAPAGLDTRLLVREWVDASPSPRPTAVRRWGPADSGCWRRAPLLSR